jgi:hypothetical protein
MRVDDGVGAGGRDILDGLGSSINDHTPQKDERTETRSAMYVASGAPVMLLGTRRSMRNGTRKIFIPAFLKMPMAVVLGQM